MYKHFFKRFFDIIISLLFMVLLSPVLLVTCILIMIDSKGPIIFKQERIGLNGKVFKIYKFRSMVVGAENTGTGVYSNRQDTRVTKIGKILRSTSIDELPQIFNIIKGDMSFIGPRPPLTYHPWTIDKYTTDQMRMFEVRPGITGWAQINGRKGVEWNNRIKLNVWYVDNVSFLLDLHIFIVTILKVVTNEDNENNNATVTTEKEEVI